MTVACAGATLARMTSRYHVFQTAAGWVALGWHERGVTSLRLPEESADAAERALLRRMPAAHAERPGGEIADAADLVVRYFAGERVTFDAVPVDLGAQESFFTQVYARIRHLGWGETTTYGAIARALGAEPAAAQGVGQAMARNPVPLIMPCHRVLAAGGGSAGSRRRVDLT